MTAKFAAKPSIVQAEFFLPEGSLHLKQVVRFFDHNEELALLALKIEMLEAKQRYYMHRLFSALRSGGWAEQKFSSLMLRWLGRCSCRLHERKFDLAYRGLARAIASGDIAVERRDRRFCIAFRNELPKLVEPLDRARQLWLFVFSHNSLCADKNISVASAM